MIKSQSHKKGNYMKTVDLVERIEGEAKLVCSWNEDNIISDARMEFLNFRGFEYILKNKNPLDALVYAPRICGICGQAHLKATVDVLEKIYENVGDKLSITNKAKLLREIGLNIEIIDSHIKWFYMFIMPDMAKFSQNDYKEYAPFKGKKWLKGTTIASEIIKSLAIIGGQWPHTSYMIPGGVVSDPTTLDLATMQNYLDNAIRFFEEEFAGVNIDEYLSFSSINDLKKIDYDLKDFIDIAFEKGFDVSGKAFNRLICLTDTMLFQSGKKNKRIIHNLDFAKISEDTRFTFNVDEDEETSEAYTWAKSVSYASNFYETGPLARAVLSERKFISKLHKEYEDCVLVRVLARIDEFVYLLYKTKELIKKIDVSENSFIKPPYSMSHISNGTGIASVEASRGSLLHEVTVKNGKIDSYNVITPTVWNLGPGNKNNQSIAQKAIIGSDSIERAKIILRSFDVCSVCTTH